MTDIDIGAFAEALNDKADRDLQNTFINVVAGTVNLADNSVLTMSVSAAVNFVLPEVADAKFHQVCLFLSVTGTPTISWGTTQFFNKATPEIEAGRYDVIYEYDNSLGAWVCGVLPKGAAE